MVNFLIALPKRIHIHTFITFIQVFMMIYFSNIYWWSYSLSVCVGDVGKCRQGAQLAGDRDGWERQWWRNCGDEQAGHLGPLTLLSC